MADARTISLRQVSAVALGNALEFFDFLSYAFFAVYIGRAFFPSADSTASLLASLATFGAGFLTRPIGAIVLGRLGDRIGRKPTMIFSFATMGVAMLGIALTPSYGTIGIAAPILVILFRLIQGFALGGEVGSSTSFLVEAAPVDRRELVDRVQLEPQRRANRHQPGLHQRGRGHPFIERDRRGAVAERLRAAHHRAGRQPRPAHGRAVPRLRSGR